MEFWGVVAGRPRRTAVICAVLAAGLGLIHLMLAGAPMRMAIVNGGALALGLAVFGAGAAASAALERFGGLLQVAGGVVLLLTAWFGASLDGATRWILVGGLVLQPSLLILLAMMVGFARRPGPLSAIGLIVAALALALQPDRAMAGALTVGMAVLATIRRDWISRLVLAAAGLGFAASLLQADHLPAQPFVERVFFTAFEADPLAGVTVVAGAALLLVPGLGALRGAEDRGALAVFGAAWLAILAASLMGNYPTPVVGYGASGILGYLIGAIGLPKGSR